MLEDFALQVEKRVQRTANDKLKNSRNRKLLTSVVTLLIDEKSENTALIRKLLTTLFGLSQFIDRELFMFEHHKENCLDDLSSSDRQCVLERRTHLLTHLSGWQVPSAPPWNNELRMKQSKMYLEMPYRRSHNQANSHLMAEALYREQDPEFALLLLRHGLPPSFLYLWSVCILIDMKFTMNRAHGFSDEMIVKAFSNSDEAKVIRYFSRARHFIKVHPVGAAPGERDWELEMRMFRAVDSYDDFLVCPEVALPLIPIDRYLTPSRLAHQCRLRLRAHLLKHGRLPRDIYKLPLPESVRRYVDLLED